MLSWEKPLVKPMAPVSIFHHIIFLSICYFCHFLFCNLYFPIYTTKIPKIFILLSLLDLTFASGREGIDNPFIALVARFLFVCAGTRRLACYLLLDWYLGSQKLREILMLLCCITLSSSRENQRSAREVAKTHPLAMHYDRLVLLLLLSSWLIHVPLTMRLCNSRIPEEHHVVLSNVTM